MPITPTLLVDPTVMTNNWAAGLSSPTNAQKLVYKYTHPKRLFNADPAGSQVAYQTGVAAALALNKYSVGLAAADPNAAALNMTQFGATNWSNSGTSKKYKFARKAASLASAINQVSGNIASMPKGKGANNMARMQAWFTQMSAFNGKITSA